jgi:hypothetical protein
MGKTRFEIWFSSFTAQLFLPDCIFISTGSSSTYPDGELPPHLVDDMRVPLQENVGALADKICIALQLKLRIPSLWPLINDGDFFPERIPFMRRIAPAIPFTAGKSHFRSCWDSERLSNFLVLLFSGQKIFLQKVGSFSRSRYSDWYVSISNFLSLYLPDLLLGYFRSNQSVADVDETSDDRNVFRSVVEKNMTDVDQSGMISTSQTLTIDEDDEEIVIEDYDND